MRSLEQDSIIIRRGISHSSQVDIGPSKHAANAVAGALGLTEQVTVQNPPPITDFQNLLTLYHDLGADISADPTGAITVFNGNLRGSDFPNSRESAIKQTRSSILLLPSTLLRTGRITLPIPEGDWPGARSPSSALQTAEQFGVDVAVDDGKIVATLAKPEKRKLEIDVKNRVHRTLFALTMATGLGGEYKIHNPFVAPEVDNLVEVLQKMGAEITGLDTQTITVKSEGMQSLKNNVNVQIAPDVAETMFWLVYANLHQLPLTGVFPHWNQPVSEEKFGPLGNCKDIFSKTNIQTQIVDTNSFTVVPQDVDSLHTVDIVPPFPHKKGKHLDAMPHLAILMGALNGSSRYFDDRHKAKRIKWLKELEKMGARVLFQDDVAQITGTGKGHYETVTQPTAVAAEDIRAVASLLLAGSSCEEPVTVGGLSHVRRAYTNLVPKMSKLGTEIVDAGSEL
jgi:UDP-N-acetylglucosamine 1-carboxyvinyltransferase